MMITSKFKCFLKGHKTIYVDMDGKKLCACDVKHKKSKQPTL